MAQNDFKKDTCQYIQVLEQKIADQNDILPRSQAFTHYNSVIQLLFGLTLLAETGLQAVEVEDMGVIHECFPSILEIALQALEELYLLGAV